MKMYNDKAMLTQRESLENWQGWEYKPNKRNGLKQDQHLTIARTIKQAKKQMGIMKAEGRPKKEHIVTEYLKEHPGATKTDVVRATGMAYDTVRKYWNPEKVERDKKMEIIEQLMSEYDQEHWGQSSEGVARASYYEGLLLEHGLKDL